MHGAVDQQRGEFDFALAREDSSIEIDGEKVGRFHFAPMDAVRDSEEAIGNAGQEGRQVVDHAFMPTPACAPAVGYHEVESELRFGVERSVRGLEALHFAHARHFRKPPWDSTASPCPS